MSDHEQGVIGGLDARQSRLGYAYRLLRANRVTCYAWTILHIFHHREIWKLVYLLISVWVQNYFAFSDINMQVTSPSFLLSNDPTSKMQTYSVPANVVLENLQRRRIANSQARKLQGRLQEAYKLIQEQKSL